MRLVLDTSVLIAADPPPADAEVAVASVVYAELAFGVRAAVDPVQQALRQARLDRLTSRLGPGLPFDDAAATAYGLLAGLVQASGRNPRARALDLMIAATAYANDAGVLTRNAADFTGLEPLVTICTP
ncbi:PIN domain-containing protein [Amnibacterium endophyticum]|uniref:Ribonuclease VapC n=1 Tax=Amnibacterium endophyticum TaxID=2109337 RepID=A0ABW4LG78_9MICO